MTTKELKQKVRTMWVRYETYSVSIEYRNKVYGCITHDCQWKKDPYYDKVYAALPDGGEVLFMGIYVGDNNRQWLYDKYERQSFQQLDKQTQL